MSPFRRSPNHRRAFRLWGAALDEIVAHATQARPNECCGLLLGVGGLIEHAHRARNLDECPTRFLIDPRDHFAAIHAARGSGRTVLGVYHSHPFSPARPSPSDLAEASYAEYLYLIVGFDEPRAASPVPDVRAFRLEQTSFVEQKLIIGT